MRRKEVVRIFNELKFRNQLETKHKALLRRVIRKDDPEYTEQNKDKLNQVRDLYRKYKKHGRI